MPALKHDSNCQSILIGVPKIKLPPLWVRFFYKPKTMKKHKVPEHFRSSGMYCPVCRKGQPFSDGCAFCGCAFPFFVAMNTNKGSLTKWRSKGTVPSGTARQGAPLNSFLIRLKKASLRTRAIAICTILLLLLLLVTGIVQYRSYSQRNYSQKYVLALYGINSGMNLTGMVSEGNYKAWKEGASSEDPSSSNIDFHTRTDLEAVNAEIEGIMGKMGTPPGGYDQAARILQKLYAIYEKRNSMVINFPDSLSRHKAEIDATKEDFLREIDNLKANLPATLVEELKRTGQKYDLRFMSLQK